MIAIPDLIKFQIPSTITRLDAPSVHTGHGEIDLSTAYHLSLTLVCRFLRPTRFTPFPLFERRLTYIR